MGELVVAGARLYDGRGGDPLDDATVVVEGDRIRYAGPGRGAPRTPPSATTIDAEGRAVVPGLIDCHVHLCFDGSPDFAADAAALTPESARERCVEAVTRALDAGITTVRDLGGVYGAPVEIARAVRERRVRGARVLTAGEVLTAPGGHAHFIGREISSPEEMRKAVAALHDAGADLVKIIATGGVLTPGIGAQQSAFPPETLRAAVEEAHGRGMRVAAHAIGAEGIEAAARAGVDSVEHGCFLTEGAIAAMLAAGSYLVGTLCAPDRISTGEAVPQYARDKSAEVQVQHRASFRRGVLEGLRIASGTDAGTPYNPHGSLWYELQLMHDAGMPLERLLPAATSDAAALLGVEALGVIAEGMVADLVFLDGDPLSDVAAYRRPAVVVQAGVIVADRR